MPKKTYSIHWENDEAVSFEVDGATYRSLEDIPSSRDRDKLAAMMQAAEEEDGFDDVKFDEKEFEAINKKAAVKVEKIIVGVFSGVATLMLLIAAVSSFLNVRQLSREESAPGVVTEIVQKREYVNEQDRVYDDYYFPVVEFRASDGKTRRVQMSEGNSVPAYEAGDEVTVLYNPDRPLEARIQSADSAILMWILPAITGVLGVAFAGAVWMVSRFLFPQFQTDDESASRA